MLKTLATVLALFALPAAANAQRQAPSSGATLPLSGSALVASLKHGGYVLLMRHAASPIDIPNRAQAEPDNAKPERQLDATGKASAAAFGQALAKLELPIGRVESSPTYRALQTARLAGLPAPETFAELGDGGGGMQAQGEAAGAWLRGRVAAPPRAGTDTLILTHLPNIRAAYPVEGAVLADGEALVFRPDGGGGATLVARIKIEDWPALAAAEP